MNSNIICDPSDDKKRTLQLSIINISIFLDAWNYNNIALLVLDSHCLPVCFVHYFVTWFYSVLLLDNTHTTLRCPNKSFVGILMNFRFNDLEAVKYQFIDSVQVNLVQFSFNV